MKSPKQKHKPSQMLDREIGITTSRCTLQIRLHPTKPYGLLQIIQNGAEIAELCMSVDQLIDFRLGIQTTIDALRANARIDVQNRLT